MNRRERGISELKCYRPSAPDVREAPHVIIANNAYVHLCPRLYNTMSGLSPDIPEPFLFILYLILFILIRRNRGWCLLLLDAREYTSFRTYIVHVRTCLPLPREVGEKESLLSRRRTSSFNRDSRSHLSAVFFILCSVPSSAHQTVRTTNPQMLFKN
jgi:hypothetical protein